MSGTTKRRLITTTIALGFIALAVRYIIANFQWTQIGESLAQMNWLWLLLGGGASIMVYWWIRAARLHAILHRLGATPTLRELYKLNSIYLSLAIVTPFQSGEVLKIEALKRMGIVDRAAGYTAFIIERAMDLLVVLCLAIVCVLIRADEALPQWLALSLAGAMVLCVPLAAWLIHRWPTTGRLGPIIAPLKLATRPMIFTQCILLTAAGWATVALGWMASLQGLDIQLDAIQGLTLVSVMTLVNILSFVPGAIGVSEAGVAEFLVRYGNTPSLAQAGALATRFLSILIIGLGLLQALVSIRRKSIRNGDLMAP
ncbi:MAG: lysylphosphatidylglycerol synthase transmembrane domain-containing protein [Phycisphaeraceae bacterium]